VIPGSLRLDGRSAGPVFATPQGETIAVIPSGGGWLEFDSCPAPPSRELSPAEFSRLTRLPAGISLPAGLESALASSLAAPASQRAAWARSRVRERLVYDTTAACARLYEKRKPEREWLASVLAIGRGDCDILNGFQVLLLRKLGVPSRLAIGMTGDRGRVRPQLHAWSEYFDQGWKISDATSFGEAGTAALERPYPSGKGSIPDRQEDAAAARGMSPFPPWSTAVLLLLFLAGASRLFFRLMKKGRGRAPLPPPEQMKKPLTRLIQHALLEPAAWGADNPIWRHRLLPTLGSDAVSIQRAKRLLRGKTLFMTANRNPLAMAMAASGITVLDLSDPSFAPMGNLLTGAVDTDRLCRLRPEEPGPDGADGLLAAVNRQLRRGWRKATSCLSAPGLSDADFLKVSLPKRVRRPPFYFPRRFIAVNPFSTALSRSSSLHSLNPGLAVVRFLRLLQAEQMLDDSAAARLAGRAARRFLRSFHG
jgi:hypothetical protein